MQHDIRHEVAGQIVRKRKEDLFGEIYNQIDSSLVNLMQSTDPIKKDNWRQIRKVIGEYVGNIYTRDSRIVFIEINISTDKIEISIAHDGTPFDQQTQVQTISQGLYYLEAATSILLGTSQAYDGFIFSVKP